MSQSKESLIWWKSPIHGEKLPKWEKNPNDLYNIITQEEREKHHEKNQKKDMQYPCSKTVREEDEPSCEGGLGIYLALNLTREPTTYKER